MSTAAQTPKATPNMPCRSDQQAASKDACQKLDNDILLMVAEYAGDTKTWASLSACSRDLHRRTESNLHSTFIQKDADGNDVRSFLRRILAKPSRANYLKNFTATALPDPRPEDPVSAIDMSVLTQAERIGIHKACRQNNIYELASSYQIWEWNIYGRKNWDACVALLLSLCSNNLESITMVDYDIRNEFPKLIEGVLKHTVDRQAKGEQLNSMSNLHTVSINACGDHGHMNLEYVLPYLAIPSVRKFSADRVEEDTFPKNYTDSFHATDLVLTTSSFEDFSMINFLKCFKQLERITYQHDGDIDDGYYNGTYDLFLDPSAIGVGVQHLKYCLEEVNYVDLCERESEVDPVLNHWEFPKLRGYEERA